MKIPNLHYAIHAAFCEDRLRSVQGLPAWLYHRVHAPYAMMPFGDDPCVLMPVNRQYSPLGVDNENWVSYEPYASQAIRFASDLKDERGIWDPQPFYLFRRSPVQRGDYVARLLKLASIAVDPAGARVKLGLEGEPT